MKNHSRSQPSGISNSWCFTRSSLLVILVAGWVCAAIAQSAPDILWTASGHSREVNAVAFSPNGALLASASDDYTVKLWRVTDGALVRTLWGHQQDVQSVAFSPDGTRLYSSGKDSTIRVWRIPEGTPLQALAEDWLAGFSQVQPRHALALSRDGQWIASGRTFWQAASSNWVGWLQVRQATNLVVVKNLFLTNAEIRSLAFAPEGTCLAAATLWRGSNFGTNLYLWQTAGADWAPAALGEASRETHNAESICFSPNGNWLAASFTDGLIRIWRRTDGALEHSLTNASLAREIAFAPDSASLAAASAAKTLRLWTIPDNQLRWTQPGGDSFRAVAFSPNGDYLATGNKDDSVALWRTANGTNILAFTAHTEPVRNLLLSPNGRFLASAAFGKDDHSIRVWDTHEGALLWSSNPYSPAPWAFAPDSETFLVGATLYRAADGAIRRSFRPSADVTSAAFSPDGLLAIGTSGWLIELWRPSDGLLLRCLTNFYGPVGKLSFSYDGKYLASANPYGAEVKIWRVSDGALLESFSAGSFAWSEMDDSLALMILGTSDVLAFYTWSQERLELKAPGLWGLDGFLSLSPDFQHAVSAHNSWLSFHRVTDRKQLQFWDKEVNGVASFAFSRDGRFVACGREDASILFARNPVGGIAATSQPPMIVVQPLSQTVEAGQQTTLWVKAGGTEPLTYEWHLNGASVPGATNCVFTRVVAGPAHTESCSVIVRNSFGTATSQIANLSVLTPPTITAKPQSQVVDVGATVAFHVSAQASEPLVYQWRFNGLDVPGATGPTLTLSSVRPENSGEYTIRVAGQTSGYQSSATALLEVRTPLAGLWQTNVPPYGPDSSTAFNSVAFSPNGSRLTTLVSLYFHDEDFRDTHYLVHWWNPTNGVNLGTKALGLTSLRSLSPDGNQVVKISYLLGTGEPCLVLTQLTNGWPASEILLLTNTPSLSASAFSPDGKLLAVSVGTDTWVWRTSDGHLLHTFSNSTAYALAFSLRGDYLAAAGDAIRVWKLDTGELSSWLDQPVYGRTCLALSPDGSLLATGGEDRIVQLRSLPDGVLLRVLPGRFSSVVSLAFARDGALLGAIRSPGVLELWRTADGVQLPLNLSPALSGVYGMAFSPATNLLATLDQYYRLSVFDYSVVLPPTPPHLSISRSPGACVLTIAGERGREYSVLASTNLTSWSLLTNLTSTNSINNLSVPALASPYQFYRAVAK